ncbi:hypothetical protein TNCV_2442751 [Trichonephila clavipes]|nr:hypothetical protein TNCV_2442751 [Trichonephila clavipes]
MKTKEADVETAIQRNPKKIPSIYINIIRDFISLLNSDKAASNNIDTDDEDYVEDTAQGKNVSSDDEEIDDYFPARSKMG